MGLDIVLALIILGAGVRGWFRGFVLQAIRLGGLIGAVYSAAPLRDAARPYVNSYLPTIRPELLDRLLWWLAAILCYVVTVGLASLAVKMARRRPFGEVEQNRTDQFAGFLLGGIKGAAGRRVRHGRAPAERARSREGHRLGRAPGPRLLRARVGDEVPPRRPRLGVGPGAAHRGRGPPQGPAGPARGPAPGRRQADAGRVRERPAPPRPEPAPPRSRPRPTSRASSTARSGGSSSSSPEPNFALTDRPAPVRLPAGPP